jgi:dolichyl-phosphate beta-glucosyltransferase
MSLSQAYLALLAWTPPPPYELPSEKQYRSPKDPNTPLPLPSIHDPASLDLSVIIPAYNETNRLPSMLSSTLDHLLSSSSQSPKRRTFEILIVDDGSSDGTAAMALKLAAERYAKADIRVVQLERNRGKGGAVRHGMLHGRGRRLLMVDADGASRFADVELLLNALDEFAPAESDAAGVAIGSRAHLVRTEAVVKVRRVHKFIWGKHSRN